MRLASIYCFLMCFLPVQAQDTLFLNKDYKETDRSEAFFYRIDDRTTPGDHDLIRKTFWINGNPKSEIPFLEKKDDLTQNGLARFWYENGQLHYSQEYKKGERHGELVAFWENGRKRRHDFFKKGKFRSGKVWNEQGVEIEHFPVMVPAMFPGGQQALQDYLKERLPVNANQPKNTEVRFVVPFLVDKKGKIQVLEVKEQVPEWYLITSKLVLENMPAWNPGKHMGEPVKVFYALPLTFRK